MTDTLQAAIERVELLANPETNHPYQKTEYEGDTRGAHEMMADLRLTLTALRQRIAELEAGLRPISDIGGALDHCDAHPDSTEVWLYCTLDDVWFEGNITVSDLRTARTLLQKAKT
jgi:hypothetical protein